MNCRIPQVIEFVMPSPDNNLSVQLIWLNPRRCSFNDCIDPMFTHVEEAGRCEYEPLSLEVSK